VWEEDLVEELKISIGHILLMEEEDRWCWRPDQDAGFTVKSAYRHVSNLSGYVGPLFDSFGNLFEAFGSVRLLRKLAVLFGRLSIIESLQRIIC
jgi:hypothetical protein